MKITSISAYAVKARTRYELAGGAAPVGQLPGSDYLRFAPYPQLYSQNSEALVVRVDTDEGVSGWGECQTPIAPEVAQTVIAKIIGPAVLGQDPLATNVRFADMYGTMRVRGQGGGYQMDAIAGLDTALWDIRGKVAGRSIADLLGGRFASELPCYVTGLRGHTLPERLDEAKGWAEQGIGIKPCLGFGVREDAGEVEQLRAAIGDQGQMMVDGVWRYSLAEAVQVGRAFEQSGVEFLEAPLHPEDVAGHARLAQTLDLAIAIGEPLRSRYAFLPWLEQRAMAVCQPDVMRNGISETARIATLAEAFNIPVAPHTGCLTVIGMSATWQLASSLSNLLVQEYQPVMLEVFNPWLTEPLQVRDGHLQLPTGPGLGLEIDHDRLLKDVDGVVTIGEPQT